MLKYVPLSYVLTLALSAQTVETTAMIGLAQGQTAQLNLLNPGVQAPAVGVICTAAVSYFDSAGAMLKSSTVSVKPGTSDAFDLSADTDLNIAVGARREIRAQISIPAVPPPPSTGASPIVAASCKLIPTLEIFDSVSGRTLVTLGHVETIPAVVAAPATAN